MKSPLTLNNPVRSRGKLSNLLVPALGFWITATPATSSGEIVNRWSFNTSSGSAPRGTAMADSISGAVATVRGNGSTFTGTSLAIYGTTTGNQPETGISGYIDLPNGIFSSKTDLTLEIWAAPLSYKANARLFDFGRVAGDGSGGGASGEIVDTAGVPGADISPSDAVYVNFCVTSLSSQRMKAIYNGVTAAQIDNNSSTSANTQYHYVFTFQDGIGGHGATGGRITWYRNGSQMATADVNFRLRDIPDVNNWLGRSNFTNDSLSHASYNEVRIYNHAMTPAEITSSRTAGPDALFGPPVTASDAAIIHPGQKVLVNVLANDSNGPIASTLQIINPPTAGTATVRNGKILYAHANGDALPESFTYRVANSNGSTADGVVTISQADSLRLTNPALAMPAASPSTEWKLNDALPGLTFTQPVCITGVPRNTKRLFIGERLARIIHVPDVTATAPSKNIFLDLRTVVAGRTPSETIQNWELGENGLLGLAFHPQYATNGYFYVAYTVRINGGSYYQRISRFSVSATDPTVADPASEVILLQQLDEVFNHNGGDLHFGPSDGYLYYTAGDEANANDVKLNSQRINKDFFCGVFRIDVDKKPGNLAPNPHSAIPTDSGVARFSVPIDNPYVHTSLGGTWTGTYNGSSVSPLSTVRTEFWATGLRHTWRMSFDPVTGDLWGGDVGQETYEEVNKIVKGGNYGWVYREGANRFNNSPIGAAPSGYTSIDPVYEYVHSAVSGGNANFKGNSVVGGYVYRGTRYPSLLGSYVFCDSVSGHVWQMNTTTGATVRLTGLPGAYGVFSAQGIDPSNKDLLFAAYNNGKIMRLASGDVNLGSFPTTLTATGLFADLTDLSPAPGMIPYKPNLSFWSDHATKNRWFTIPSAADKITWDKDGNWSFPTGAVWVKHFDLEMTRGNPETKRRIETRVLVKTAGGSYGVSYRWNTAQTEASLVGDAGEEFNLTINDDGTNRTQRWQIPGRSSCLTCHTPAAGHILSFNTRQLNLDNQMNGYSGNQISLLSSNGFFSNDPGPVTSLPRHAGPDDTQYPLEQRARSYFAVNCAYCHQTGGSVSGFWDGRAHLTLEQTGLVNGNPSAQTGEPAYKYIVPGDTAHSVALQRMAASNGFTRMPPLGTNELDSKNIQLITDWINNSLPGRKLYPEWRDDFFTSSDPAGNKDADPDGDSVSNWQEYLIGTPPLSGTGFWQASSSGGTLRFNRKAFRHYEIETSEDLGNWTSWKIPELRENYVSTDENFEIPIPPTESGQQFFRFLIREP